jgi:hypothetical protein
MTFGIAEPFRTCHSEEQSDEESRSRQGTQLISKNEMLHFFQHNMFHHTFMASPLHFEERSDV